MAEHSIEFYPAAIKETREAIVTFFIVTFFTEDYDGLEYDMLEDIKRAADLILEYVQTRNNLPTGDVLTSLLQSLNV